MWYRCTSSGKNHLSHDDNAYKKFKQELERNEGRLVHDWSLVDWEQITFKQQQIWESGTPEITFETAWTKPENIQSIWWGN